VENQFLMVMVVRKDIKCTRLPSSQGMVSPELLLAWLIPQDEDGEDSSLLNSVTASSSSLGIGWWRDSEESPCVVLQGICLR
jgi:hypothetical protein